MELRRDIRLPISDREDSTVWCDLDDRRITDDVLRIAGKVLHAALSQGSGDDELSGIVGAPESDFGRIDREGGDVFGSG
jgi:hypothetical protein